MKTARGVRAKAFERLGNPLEWNEATKVLVILGLLVPMILGGLLRVLYMTQHPELEPYVSRPTLEHVVRGVTGYLLFVLILIVAGLWLRRTGRPTRAYAHLANQSWWLLFAWFAYLIGLATSPLWVIYMLLGMLCLLLFDLRVAVAGMSTALAVIVVTAIAERLGSIPYAPYFAEWPEIDGRLADAWLISSLAWPAAASIVTFTVFAGILHRARRTSDRLAEMTEVLKQMFGRYMSTEVMKTLLEEPGALELGGTRRRVTMLLTDLRGFSTLAERLSPENVLALLNDYFEVMVEVCLQRHGAISEITGDALLVTFGAPQEMADHAAEAVACAIEMQNAMAQVNEHNARSQRPELQMGIAVHTADVVVGNIGSEKRSKFGVVGSAVNMTSRIESYAVGGQVLASQSIVDALGDRLRIDGQREIMPKGFSQPLTIYEIGGIGGDYNLALEHRDEPLAALRKPIPVRWERISGKHLGGGEGGAQIARFSRTGLELTPAGGLHALEDIRLHLTEGSAYLTRGDFYAKVTRQADGVAELRFTAIPPEILTYFEGLRS